MLVNVGIGSAIAARTAAIDKKLGASTEEVLHANRCIIDGDIAALYGPDGKFLHPTEMPRDLRRAITRIKTKVENVTAGDGHQDTVLEVWFEPRGPAIDRDYKRHGLLVEREPIPVNVTFVWQTTP